jgi:hypothetical protein
MPVKNWFKAAVLQAGNDEAFVGSLQSSKELGKICSTGAMRDKYDLDPFTETSCSEHRKKGSMKVVAPSR